MNTHNRNYFQSFLCATLFCGVFVSKVQGQTLSYWIESALKGNPEIQALELEQSRKVLAEDQAGALPNTDIGLGYFLSEPETRTGPQQMKFSIKQQFPWFGTITARKNYKQSLSELQFETIAIAKRRLIRSVSERYYMLLALDRKQKIVVKQLQLIATYKTIVLSKINVGEATVGELLNLKLQQYDLEAKQTEFRHQFQGEKAQFYALLNQKELMPIQLPEIWEIPETDTSADSLSLSLHPELIQYDKLFASVVQSEMVNTKDSQPKFGIGIDYIPVGLRESSTILENGKDILMPMIGVSVPIFNNSYRIKSKQNRLKQQEVALEKQNRMNHLSALLEKARNLQKAAKTTYQKRLESSNQVEQILRLALQNYQVGSVNFDTILKAQQKQLNLQLQQVDALLEYFNQTIVFHYLTENENFNTKINTYENVNY